MASRQPALGSLAIQAPTLNPQVVHVSSQTCHDLSLFKDLLKEYRKLDDSITMRINRTNAQFVDMERLGASGKGTVQDRACSYLWKDLVENWKRRKELVEYCVDVVDRSLDEKRKSIAVQEGDAKAQRKTQAAIFEDEVKRNQVRNELTVERIVRARSLDAFRSRCKYFVPPLSDAEARTWWDNAHAAR
ncbi:hypothetical protein PLICRDRAFT_34061 [Plicaturopsis crispa FD-325 SS-3]|nr:hypothetical protein PLICRDRAFT_34061 [Plicaturopsis crispa FD-325 SS-3]